MSAQSRLSAFFTRRSAKTIFAVLTLFIVVTLTGVAARAWWTEKAAAFNSAATVAQSTPVSGTNGYVRRVLLRPQLRYALNVLGDRVEKPGKERVVFVGTLRRQEGQQPAPCRLILELPGLMRFEEGVGAQTRVIGFDGNKAWVQDGRLTDDDVTLIETFAFDSPDHFLLSQSQGYATRALGQRFRLDTSAITKDTVFYDIYQIGDQINIANASRPQPKMFYLNSTTQLLERVHYEIKRDGQPINVEVLLTGWEKSNNQQLPRQIKRLENGKETLQIIINAAAITQRANDGIFRAPQGQ